MTTEFMPSYAKFDILFKLNRCFFKLVFRQENQIKFQIECHQYKKAMQIKMKSNSS